MEEKNNINVNIGTDITYKHEIIWQNVLVFLVILILGGYGFYLFLTGHISYKSMLWVCALHLVNSLAITAGAHRYYAHRSYKAKLLLRAVFIASHSSIGQKSLFTWAHEHRLHHRYSDTDADPHNSKRGLFFSYVGWLMMKKHPYTKAMGRKIDMSDLLADPLVMWQHKYLLETFFVFGVLAPVAVPVYFLGEPLFNSLFFCCFFRYLLTLHVTLLSNSIVHLYGTRPYNKNLQAVESWFIALITMGDGWHNYHHAIPCDYKAAEEGMPFNVTARLIRLLETVGLAYDLKSASPEIVQKIIGRTGDGTHYFYGTEEDKSAITAFGPVHPLNPTYTSTETVPNDILDREKWE